MTFLPEDDQEYLEEKGLKHELHTDGNQRGIMFPGLEFDGNLWCYGEQDRTLVRRTSCDVLILIPPGYATTKLDSFYTAPHLKHQDGSDPKAATGTNKFFNRDWQFWSRHLKADEWRPGVDGLRTYLAIVLQELHNA